MQGLRHWKANFRGFNLDTHRPLFDLGSICRQSIYPTGNLLCRPAIYCADRQFKVADRHILLADDLTEYSTD